MGQNERLQSPAASSQALAATTALDLSSTGAAAGFHANGTGNFVGRLVGDAADRTFSVIEGVTYPYRVEEVDATSAVAIVLLFNDLKG